MKVAGKRSVLFVIPSLRGGGAQRVVVTLLEFVDRGRFDVSLALVEKRGPYLEDVPGDVEVLDFGSAHVRNAAIELVTTIRARRPDVVFSSQGHLNLMIASLRPLFPRRTRFIARETNIPSLVNDGTRYASIFPAMYRTCYTRFDRIICQSQDMKRDLKRYARIGEERLAVIHNPVNYSYIQRNAAKEAECFAEGKTNLLAAGKLTRQKGFDLLIEAFSKVRDRDCVLTILGEGPEAISLRNLSATLRVSDRVRFVGFKSNPYPCMAQADVFVLSSRFEGLPNVVLEANACGTPVVAFECPGGINEIIEDGVNGWKVKPGDTEGLAHAISVALERPLDRRLVREAVVSRFPLQETIRKFETVFAE